MIVAVQIIREVIRKGKIFSCPNEMEIKLDFDVLDEISCSIWDNNHL